MENNTNSLSPDEVGAIESIEKTETYYFIKYLTGEVARLNILNDHVIRFYMSPTGDFLDYPEPNNPEDVAKITIKKITDYGYEAFEQSNISDNDSHYIINANGLLIVFDKIRGTMKIHDEKMNKDLLIESNPLSYKDNRTTQTLFQRSDEYFFGGGMQNGRFSHKGESINIVNTNKWDDGGVSSPCPFYWSSYGYGVFRNTWQPGVYDFGSKSNKIIKTSHDDSYFDAFIFINAKPSGILKDYYELTGQPIMMPEYAFYEAHLNAFNRDYWVKVSPDEPGAILFEDGLYYKTYKPNEVDNNTGILESLNGEKDNYQFSARGMIDRYKRHDMPLGWFIPNDGYGSGYGQSDSLDGDIENLRKFTEYSLENGVQVGLWTESNLHPVDPMNPKKGERDLSKEVGVANIVALKCDVAWIGCGYSFGLNAVENAASIFTEKTNSGVRPFIIMVDGWAGTQRYAGIWSGDQTGGVWEYIRFHIPTYIGTGLSGQPIVGADMDGIYGGEDSNVNVRDYQWKTFTPLQLNMDGWGRIPKTPFSFDETTTSINRAYLKLKSMLMPYNYTIGHESTNGLPMVRAMFLEFPDSRLAYTTDCQYQFMWGPSLLVAPIYSAEEFYGDSVRHGIYLPDPNQVWIDFFTGNKYQGGKIFNNISVPLWKIPVFVKDGAIIPMTNANNNPFEIKRDNRIFTLYPNGKSSFVVYEDDGISADYLNNHFAMTKISMVGPQTNEPGDLMITIKQTTGAYEGITKERTTLLQIMASSDANDIKVAINGESLEMNKVENDEDFEKEHDVFYFKNDFVINPYLKEFDDTVLQKFLLIKIHKLDVTSSEISIKIKNFVNAGRIFSCCSTINEKLRPPRSLVVDEERINYNSITVKWETEADADYYEIERDESCYSNIQGINYLFEDFKCETQHSFRIRSVNRDGSSEWSDYVHATTSTDPFKYVVTGVNVTCNLPCQPAQEICNLVNSDKNSMWHTNWGTLGQANPQTDEFLKLSFDLGDVYELDKIEYYPRNDAGNGTFLRVQYKFSDDGTNWSELSNVIEFDNDNTVKTIPLDGAKLRYLELTALETIGNFGSGESLLFYKNV
ncbi:alpha-glucosidase 2-like [Epargyreus clarus]|uniref:alpha-glucosidase 2-like n=1 Tax=Epargyreus clarus TaxID=520877 RepID=UPI003C2DBE50